MQTLGFNRDMPLFADKPEQPYGLQPAGSILYPSSTVLLPGSGSTVLFPGSGPTPAAPNNTAANIGAGITGGVAAFTAIANQVQSAVAAGRQDEIERLRIQSQDRLQTLMAQQQSAQAAAARASNTAQADAARAQADQAMAQMREMQTLMAQMAAAQNRPAPPPPPQMQQQQQQPQQQFPMQQQAAAPAGGVTTTQLAIGVGVLALVGGGIYFATRSRSNPHANPYANPHAMLLRGNPDDDESSSIEEDCYDLNPVDLDPDSYRGNPFRMGSDGVRRWTTTGRSVKLPKAKARKGKRSLRRR